MAKKKANSKKANKVWKFTAELPSIGLVKVGAAATDQEVKALIAAGLRECTYLIEI